MITYKMADVVKEISVRENNPATSKYDKFVGLEHYITGEVVIRQYGGTGMLNSAMKVFQAGDILVARRNVYLRRASMVDFDGLTSGDSIVLRAENPRIAKLLPFILNSDRFWDYADQHADGTMSKRLSPKILMQYEFTLPSEEEQDRLIELLWSMDRTKQAYKQLISATDELVKSQFIEMFDTGKHPSVKLKTVCTKITDGTHKTPHYLNEGITFVSAKNIINYELDFTDVKYISKEEYEEIQKRCQVEVADILLSKSGSLGSPVILRTNQPLGLFESLAVIKYDRTQLVPEFLCEQLKSERIQLQFKNGTRGVAVKHLHLNVIGDIEIVLPPLDLQKQFAAFVRQTDKSKFELTQALEALNATYKKLISENLG